MVGDSHRAGCALITGATGFIGRHPINALGFRPRVSLADGLHECRSE